MVDSNEQLELLIDLQAAQLRKLVELQTDLLSQTEVIQGMVEAVRAQTEETRKMIEAVQEQTGFEKMISQMDKLTEAMNRLVESQQVANQTALAQAVARVVLLSRDSGSQPEA